MLGIALVPANAVAVALLIYVPLLGSANYPWQEGRLCTLITVVCTITSLAYSLVGGIYAFFRSRPPWFVPWAAFLLLFGLLWANYMAGVLYLEWLHRYLDS